MKGIHFLYEQWVREKQIFDDLIAKLKTRIGKKAIHDIRVCVKKLKAYRKLYYLLNKADAVKIKFTETDKLFDILGSLRNTQVCLELTDIYEKENGCRYEGLNNFLRNKLKQLKAWSGKVLGQYNDEELKSFEMLISQSSSPRNAESPEIQIRRHINSDFDDLKNLFHEPHRVRILLKKIYYWIKILYKDDSSPEFNTSEIDKVLEGLGQWHDNENLLTEAEYFRKNFVPVSFDESKLLKKLQKTVKEKKETLQNDSLNKVKKWKKPGDL